MTTGHQASQRACSYGQSPVCWSTLPQSCTRSVCLFLFEGKSQREKESLNDP